MSRNDGLAGESSMARVTRASTEPAAQLLAQIPQRLDPDLAVGVHLGTADDLAEVAVRVATGSGAGRAGAVGRRGPDRTVDGLGPDEVVAPADVLADAEFAVGLGVLHEPLLGQEVHRVPVAPGLTHRTGLDVAERGDAVGVDDESVGQAVGVLVVDDVRLVAGVAGEERVLVRERGPGLVEQVHLHARRDAVRRCAHVGVVDVVAVGKTAVEVGAVDARCPAPRRRPRPRSCRRRR